MSGSTKKTKMNKNKTKFTKTYFRITIDYHIHSSSATSMLCSYVTNEVFIDPHTGCRNTLCQEHWLWEKWIQSYWGS
jgi:hypothetical protein